MAPVQVMGSRAPVQVKSRAPVPKVGEYFDAEALFYRKSLTKKLARYSDRTPAAIESIRGKYLVIICISLPLTENGTKLCYRIMKAAYGEICKKDDFEMITVAAAKMDGDDVTAFEEFFTTVPGLVVPYFDFDSRGYVCDTLGFGSCTKPVTRAGVILDKDGRVLQNDDFWYSFNLYGAAFYPFTNARLNALEATLDALQRRLRM